MLVVAMMLFAMSMGLMQAAQSPTNASLGLRIGALQATLISFFGGFLCLTVLAIVSFSVTGSTGVLGIVTCEPWMLLGGPIGAYVVFGIAYCSPKLGVALTLMISMFSQITFGFIVDAFGLLGATQHLPNTLRIIGCVFFAAGILLVYKGKLALETAAKTSADAGGSRKSISAVILMISVGAAAAIQLPINVAFRSHVGLFEAGSIHFAIGTLFLLVIVLILQKGHLNSLKGVPFWQCLGGVYGAYGLSSLIITVPVLGAGFNSACNMMGQLLGGAVVDTFGFFRAPKVAVNVWRVAGMLALLCGIIIVTISEL